MIQLYNKYCHNPGVILETKGPELESLGYLGKVSVVLLQVFHNQKQSLESRWLAFLHVELGCGWISQAMASNIQHLSGTPYRHPPPSAHCISVGHRSLPKSNPPPHLHGGSSSLTACWVHAYFSSGQYKDVGNAL